MRLEYARRRMAGGGGGGSTILDIALEAGYGNVSCFSRAFRQRYGLSPSEYRRETGRA
jgi:AraC-like DNA-binding protein